MRPIINTKAVKSFLAPAALAALIVPASLAPTSLEGRLESNRSTHSRKNAGTSAAQTYFSDSFDDYEIGDFPHGKWTWRVLYKEHGNAPAVVRNRSAMGGKCLYFPQNWNKYTDVSPNIFESKDAPSDSTIEFYVSQGKYSTFCLGLQTDKANIWSYLCSKGFSYGKPFFYIDEVKFDKYRSFGRALQPVKPGRWDRVEIKLTPDKYTITINENRYGPFTFPARLGEHINVQFDTRAFIPKRKISSGDYKIDEFRIK